MKENGREKLERQIKVMSEFLNGKKIERIYLGRNVFGEEDSWQEEGCPIWDWYNYNYRIKKEPQYRAYTKEEFCKNINIHGRGIQRKDDEGILYLPHTIATDYIGIAGNYKINYKLLLEKFYWEDGSPCGVLIKDE